MGKTARKRNSSIASAIELQCDLSVEEKDFVYIDSDELLKKTDASDPLKMPAVGYVVKVVTRKGAKRAFIVPFAVEADEAEETEAKKVYYISSTSPGKLQDTQPSETGHVMQRVAVGVSSDKKLIQIDPNLAVIRS